MIEQLVEQVKESRSEADMMYTLAVCLAMSQVKGARSKQIFLSVYNLAAIVLEMSTIAER